MFMPRAYRGRYVALLAVLTNCAVPVTGLGGAGLIPLLGWQAMFAVTGAGALVLWFLRKNMPDSPRWLASRGRAAKAEALLQAIEAEAAQAGPLPPVVDAVKTTPAPGRYAELLGAGLDEVAAIPRLGHGPCLLYIVVAGKTPDIGLGNAEAMGYRIAIMPSLLLSTVMNACDAVLQAVKANDRPPSSVWQMRVAGRYRRFGADDWDALRTRFRDGSAERPAEKAAVE